VPYANPIKRQAARRLQYRHRRARAAAWFPHLWDAVPMLLAVWCVQLRAELPALEALWQEIVMAFIEPEWENRDRPTEQGLATRVMGRLSGREFQVCEMEGTDVLADLQDQEDDFRWVVVYQATHSRVARNPICPCCIEQGSISEQEGIPIEAGKTEQRTHPGAI
jgi:hypothetical protein